LDLAPGFWPAVRGLRSAVRGSRLTTA